LSHKKCKDAIVDQFRERTGQRPSIDKADLRINIHIDKDQVSVALDTSGNSLHQRGYRTATNIAPINEVSRCFIAFGLGRTR
jgi:putative N6-adenine-specific DNA methylase